MKNKSKIFVCGHNGLVGSAIVRQLNSSGYVNIITRTHKELDLTKSIDVEKFFLSEKPEYIFLAAAKVGGIHANNTYPADFIFQNLAMQINVIDAAHRHGAKKLLFLGSNCIYPKQSQQPVKEEYLLTGPLEPTNEPYAIAKISGIKMCQAYRRQYGSDFISVMPSNLYGQGDNFDKDNSHVLPGLLRRFHEAMLENAPTVPVWGTGIAQREFLFSDDLADACIFLMNNYSDQEPINIGTGTDISIKYLTELISDVVGYKGKIVWDNSKPDGTIRKLLDVSKLHALGWKHTTELSDGIRATYDWYIKTDNKRL